MMEEKLCLKRNEFQANVTSALSDLKDDEDFTDVTLACDGRQFELHQWILASCSPFFRTVLKNTKKHQHPLIYMRGVSAGNLEALVDFIYRGEANIFQGDLDAFLLIAEEFQLKGLTGNAENSKEQATSQTPPFYSPSHFAKAPNTVKNTVKEENINHRESGSSSSSSSSGTFGPTPKIHIEIPEETARKVESMITKRDRSWICLECDYASTYKSHIREHAEKHIEGLEYPCNFCGKITRSRSTLRQHIGNYHKNDQSLHSQQ